MASASTAAACMADDTDARVCHSRQPASAEDIRKLQESQTSHTSPQLDLLPSPARGRPRLHADVNAERPTEYSDYGIYAIEWNPPIYYEVVRRVGWGKYSIVFEGIDVRNQRKVVVKVLKPVNAKKIKREIKILRNLTDGPNVISLLDVVKDPQSKTPSLIFEYVNNFDFKQLYGKLSDRDIRYYIFQILKALDYSHSQGIMHRDVKPHNVMIDHENRQLRLIDWGLAEFYFPKKENNVRVASQHYKGPELLVDMRLYDYSLDIWSLGCVLAGMVFRKDPFFRGRNNFDQLVQILRVLGADDFYAYVDKYAIQLDDKLEAVLERLPRHARRHWSKFETAQNSHLTNNEVYDLLDHMLLYDHEARIIPREAMAHSYFDSIREEDLRLNGPSESASAAAIAAGMCRTECTSPDEEEGS